MSAPQRVYGGVSASDRAAARRARLLNSCLEIVGREGVAGVTVEAVCADAGVGKRYFYEAFTTRDDALDAAAAAFYEGLFADLAQQVGALAPEERLRAAVATVVGSLVADPRTARLYAESPAVPVLAARRRLALEQLTTLARSLVLGEPEGSEASDDDAGRQVSLMVRVVMTGATELVGAWLGGELDADRDDVEAAIATLAAVVTERER